MPLRWTISDPDRLVVAVAEGPVGLKDIEAYLDNVVVSGALPYAKIFDGTNGSSALNDGDMMLLGARMRAYPNLDRMGPLAVIVPDDTIHDLARLFGALAKVDRPLKIFRDMKAARAWLAALGPPSPPTRS